MKSKLINEDGPTPTQIRILSVNGGKFNGIEIGGDSQPIDLVPVLTGSTVTSYKKDFTFVAGSDQTEDASFEYVIVDPVTNANSKVSTASTAINPVNDKPELSGVVSDRLFTENDDALILDRSAAIRDIDSIGLSLATIELSNVQTGDELIYSENFWDKTTSTGKILLTSKTTQFGKTPSIFEQAIRNVKFKNDSDAPNTSATRVVKIQIKDKDPNATSESDSKNKLSDFLTFNLTVSGKNDAPSISSSGNITYQEGDSEKLILSNASLSDPDKNNDQIKPTNAFVKIGTGYRPGEDSLSIQTGYTVPTGMAVSFDKTTGSLNITNDVTGNSTMADLQNLMKKVVYVNNSEKPSSDSREILFSVSDDENVSSTVTQKSIAITSS